MLRQATGVLGRQTARGIAVTLLVTTACASSTAKVSDNLASAVSSAATIEMALASRRGNRVPAPFAERTVSESRAALEKAATSLAATPGGATAAQLVRDALATVPAPSALTTGDSAWAACLAAFSEQVRRLRAARDSAQQASQ